MIKSKRKGFTLVEIIAVIAVLAIILSIAVPLVSGVIEGNRKRAAVTSAYNYVRAINSELLNQSSNINQIDTDKLIDVGEHDVSYFKDKFAYTNPPDDGYVSIASSNVVVDACLEFFGYRVDYDGQDAIVNENVRTCTEKTYVAVEPCLDAACTSIGESENTSTWLATYYTVAYVTNTEDREANYEMVLESLPIETKDVHKIELVKYGVMTTIDDFEKFAELGNMKSYDIDTFNDSSMIKEEPNVMLEHAAGEEQITIDDIDLYCGSTNCVADIYETIKNLEEITPSSGTTYGDTYLDSIIYIPIKFTVKITKGNIDGYVYPKFEQDLVVSFNTDGGTSIESQTISYYDKATKPSTNPTKSGYKFITWNLNGEEYDFDSYVTDNITIDAVWEKVDTFNVTFDSTGGSKVSTQNVIKGKTAYKPSNPTKTGYKFYRWTLDGREYNFSTPVTQDITLVAEWKDSVTITFNTNGGSSISSQEIAINEKATKPYWPPTKLNYVFNYWTLNGEEYDFNSPVTEDITLDAVWRDALVVTFDSNGGSSVPKQYPAFISRNSNEALVAKPANPTKKGYAFVRWELDGVEFNFSKTISTNITLKAVWEKTYKVTFDSNGGSSVGSQTIKTGEKATEPTLATRCGYTLKYWTLNGERYNFNSPVTEDIHLVAEWDTYTTYKVTFDSNGGTSVATQCIPKDELAKYKTSSRSGYNFLGWYLNGVRFDFNTPITQDITLKANWEEKYNTNYGDVYVAPSTSYTLTYYTTGYITNFDSQNLSYTIDLNDFPSSYSSYLLDSTKINSIYVKGISVVEDFEKMKSEVGEKLNVISLNQENEWITTDFNNMQHYSLDNSQVSVVGQFNCSSGCTVLTIEENIADVNGKDNHSTKTLGNKNVDVLYIPLAITIKVEIGDGASLALKIKENNQIQDGTVLNYNKTNKYGSEFESKIDRTTEVEYVFLSDHYYWFGTDYTYDTSTGLYTIGGTTSNSQWSESKTTTYKYFCGSSQSKKSCDTLYEIVSYKDSTTAIGYKYSSKILTYVSNGDGLFEKDGVLFFRGNVNNNYVKFADRMWKIVRINEDGTIRMITADTVGTSVFNDTLNDNAYLGYMYGMAGASNYNLAHANNNSSTIKKFLDDWFVDNLEVHSAAIADSGFCGDRSLHSQNGYEALDTTVITDYSSVVTDSGLGYAKQNTMYGSFYRLYYGEPTFSCINENDLYSVSKANGNGRLTYPIGLLTADEIMFAGGDYSTVNSNYYLFLSGKPWWSMSPFMFINYSGELRNVMVAGVDGVYYRNVTDELNVRPVINLVSDVTIASGNGTYSNPYVVN